MGGKNRNTTSSKWLHSSLNEKPRLLISDSCRHHYLNQMHQKTLVINYLIWKVVPNTHLPTLHLHVPTRLAQRQPKMLIHPCFNLRIKHIAYQVLSTHLCLFLKSYSSLYLYCLSPSHPLLNDSAVCISAAEQQHSKTSI